MTSDRPRDALVAAVDSSVKEALAYYQGPGATSKVRIDRWGSKETLAHCVFWHQATAKGMESVTQGAQPFQATSPTDELNDRAVAEYSSLTMQQLVERARQAHQRLLRAAQALSDFEAVVMIRADGTRQTARQRLERIANHWREHVEELKKAEQPR